MSIIKILNERVRKRESLRKKTLIEVEDLINALRERFQFDTIYIFGSILTNKFRANSDIDLIIKGLNPGDFFKAYAFLIKNVKNSLHKIDLKPFEELNEDFKQRVIKGGMKIG